MDQFCIKSSNSGFNSAKAHNAASLEIWERFVESSRPLGAKMYNRFGGLIMEKVNRSEINCNVHGLIMECFLN